MIAGPFYVIPQDVKTDADAFTITFNAEVTDGTTVYKNGTVTAVVPQGTDNAYSKWEAQKYYQYTAKIELENIDDEENPDENFKPIVFKVTNLEEWVTASDDIQTTLDNVTVEP